MKKFTFKQHPRETGLRAVGHPYRGADIKMDGKVVGFISPPSALGHHDWQAWLRVEDESTPGGWRNAKLKVSCSNYEEIKQWLNDRFDVINSKLKLVPQPHE